MDSARATAGPGGSTAVVRRAGRRGASTADDDGTAVNFFFMHKPPGLRVRCQAAAGRCDELRTRMVTMIERLPVREVLPADPTMISIVPVRGRFEGLW